MNWPPVKAWTSLVTINGQRHFVSINYGGKSLDRWVIMMSVIDSNIVVKVFWDQLVDPLKWKCGWDENNPSHLSTGINNKIETISNFCDQPSLDSGLTIPITKEKIRPWFVDF